MKNFTLKSIASLVLMLMLYLANAQQADLEVCYGGALNLQTDIEGSDGQAPDGTPGSFYTWSANQPVTINDYDPGSNPNGPSNKVTVDFTGIPVGTLVTITVVETNAGCDGDPINIVVEVVPGPSITSITPDNSSICEGEVAEFTIVGTPGATVTYSFDGGATSATVILDPASGTATVSAPIGIGAHTITVTLIENGTCSSTLNITATLTVNPIPVTSEITSFP